MSDARNRPTDVPLVIAVVLTWNDTRLTRQCLTSVFANDYGNLKVILVDNGSEPPRGPELLAEFPDLELIQLAENRGFSGGANAGMQAALDRGADYVHLIGNDSTFAVDTIRLLVEEYERRPEAGAASPLLLDPGEKQVVQFYTASMDRDACHHWHHHVGEPYERGAWPVSESEFIPCVAIMFRAKALTEVGLFDEMFGTCWEDFDLCIRLQDAGWRYITVGDATAVHLGSYTTGRVSPYIVYYTTRNRLICLHRYSRQQPGSFKGLIRLARSYWGQMRGYGLTNWACHSAWLRGLKDYAFDVHGERTDAAQDHAPGRIPEASG